MTKISKLLLSLLVILTCTMSSTKTLADLSEELKPLAATSGAPFFSTDRAGAEKIAIAFRENKSCHDQIGKEDDKLDWVLVGISILVGGVLGYTLGNSR